METMSVQQPGVEVLPQPYLNADLYRNHIVANSFLNSDVLDIAPDGTTFLGRSEMTGRVWNSVVEIVNSPEEILVKRDKKCKYPDIVLDNGIPDAQFFNDSQKVVVVDDGGEISIYAKNLSYSGAAKPGDTSDAWTISCSAVEHDDAIYTVDIFPGGDRIVSGSADECIKIWDMSLVSLETIRPAHTHIVVDVNCNKVKSDIFLSAGLDGIVALWDTRCLMKKARLLSNMQCGARSVCWLSENIFVSGYESGEILLHNISQSGDGACALTLDYPIHRIVYNERLKYIAVVGDSNMIKVFEYVDNSSFKLLYENSEHSEFARDAAWSPNDDLYTCSWDGNVLKHTVTN